MSQRLSVYDVFGEVTQDRKGFERIHHMTRKKLDRTPLSTLKTLHRNTRHPLMQEYISQNIQIIQIYRGVIA
jgi:hypothetical protein